MQIQVKPINISAVEEEFYELSVQKTQNLREVFEDFKVLLEEQGCDEDEYNIEIERIAIIQSSRPNTKLSLDSLISKVVEDGKGSQFDFIFPKPGLPIIELFDGTNYYYHSDYTKNEYLYYIVQKYETIKSIVTKKEYQEITVNGKVIDYEAAKNKPFKDYLENNVNVTNNILVMPKAKKQIVEGNKNNNIEKKEIKPQVIEQKKQLKVEMPAKPTQQTKPQKVQLPQPQPQQQPPVVPPKQANKDFIKLIIKFESNNSNKKEEMSLNKDPAKSMLQLLPQILKELNMRGFDWMDQGFDIKRGDGDKLNIVYHNTQLKKLEKPLRTVFNYPQEKTVVLTFERHYDGG